ncbi:hypothetical protein, partial [Streptomyces tunisiensis]|uniref:hypothetical protein n=1 Tax=Streptomyces tunisiensis TaxID=948699 RepID=UPI0031FA18A3
NTSPNRRLESAHKASTEPGAVHMEGCALVGAAGLILATIKAQWSDTTVEALRQERQERLGAGKPVPRISLLTGLGTAPKLTPLTNT